ncbi:MAG: hypothetical protein IPJ41_17945 [Phycisphaerales bacterium]|nr:hypothetical protein [Phycisphaerales bacterium]
MKPTDLADYLDDNVRRANKLSPKTTKRIRDKLIERELLETTADGCIIPTAKGLVTYTPLDQT